VSDLCTSGKSTLQNELVGDLYEEFNSLPERPEDLPLEDLGSAAHLSPSGTLGKTSSALVNKLVASKMPARFGTACIQSYLADTWGLGPMRQSAILLFATASEPPSRVPSAREAEEFWDQVVATYSSSSGSRLQKQSRLPEAMPDASRLVDSSVMDQVMKHQKRLAEKQYQAFAEYLQGEHRDYSAAPSSDALVVELQQQLDTWTAEFSDEFLSRISPVFHPKKARRFTSWWNNARQQLLALVHGTTAELDQFLSDKATFETFCKGLEQKADHQLSILASSITSGLARRHLSCEAGNLGSISDFIKLERSIISASSKPPTTQPSLVPANPKTIIAADGGIAYTETPRAGYSGETGYVDFLSDTLKRRQRRGLPSAIHTKLLPNDDSATQLEIDLTPQLFQIMSTALQSGVSFTNKTILVTGAGEGSIGSEIIRLLLEGGACVIATTSQEPSRTAPLFQRLYEEHGGRDSELHLLQFNQASAQDCERLIDFIYDTTQGLGKDLDAILPFAAAPEAGAEAIDITAQNEVVHRLLLVNVLRLLGRIVKSKRDRGIDCRPAQVLLPLSPNHGIFGGDGLYPESKMGLATLLNRARSESWSGELAICGVNIGWTRSTGLMMANDVVAEAMESHGVITFSVREMAFNIAMLLTAEFAERCEDGVIYADFGGGLGAVDNCHVVLSKAREEINKAAEIARAINEEDSRERTLFRDTSETPRVKSWAALKRKSTLRVGFPRLPRHITHNHNPKCQEDLANAVVVVGFSELGPWGSARLRWEIESRGRLSPEGYIEMAWMMNLIRHIDGPLKGGKEHYVGWVDAKTGDPVDDADVERRYGEHIKSHAGIRFIEPESSNGYSYDPSKKEFLHEIAIDEDLPPFETSTTTADALRLQHGDKVSIHKIEGIDTCRAQICRGATILVPKAVQFPSGSVAGLLPSGWNPAVYGIPQDLIHQVDPVTLYALCCVADAFYSAGIADPMEVFKHIHLSELGNFIGSSMGGALKTRNLYRDVYRDRDVEADTLQDTYLNAAPAWVNMLLLGATGPIKTPTGACATGVESIDSGVESILAKKTKMCIVGGYDDFREEESYGFHKMKATVNVADELTRGRAPSEMSRPTAESRAGFVEAMGCGIQLLCRGDLALEMGLPIYGIIAGTSMAADKIGRSVPAPGQGILSFARETKDATQALEQISEQKSGDSPVSSLNSTESGVMVAATPTDAGTDGPSVKSVRSGPAVPSAPSNSCSPLRAALASWGLTVDDLDVASLHATSTKANDINEPDVLCKELSHLGRTPGRPLWAICQKSVTGHPKAPAAAWMLNGCLQVLSSGLVPGNRNADSIDPALRAMTHLCFPTRSVQTHGVKAFLLTSFGFGQKSGQIVGVAPGFFFASLSSEHFEAYKSRTLARQRKADGEFAKAIMENNVVKVKSKNPYPEKDTAKILLDPLMRISNHPGTGEFYFHV